MDEDRLSGAVNAMHAVLDELQIPTQDRDMQATPARFVKYLLEYVKHFDPATVLGTHFEAPSSPGVVAQRDIPFRAVCAHHLLPMFGKAHVGYIPHRRVVGLSKMARLVAAVGLNGPSMQEVIGDRIADILQEQMDAKGTIVVIEARHACMSCRGVAAPEVVTVTSSVRGAFRDVPQARAEFFSLIRA